MPFSVRYSTHPHVLQLTGISAHNLYAYKRGMYEKKLAKEKGI
jgi:hypothetical protein